MEEFKGCSGEVETFEGDGTIIQCQKPEKKIEGPHDCQKIFEKVDGKLEHTDQAFIGSKKCLTRIFSDDEGVVESLEREDSLGTCRNTLDLPNSYNNPKQALAITDHKDFVPPPLYMKREYINEEIATTLLHEDEHLGGLSGSKSKEEKAETRARKKLLD